MYDSTKAWIDSIRADLPPEALPLAGSLLCLASSMDAEQAENGRVSASMAGAYRLTHQSLLAAHRATQAPADEDDDLLSPAGVR